MSNGVNNVYPAFGKQISNWHALAAGNGKKSLPNILSMGFELTSLDLNKANAAFRTVITKHESLRTTFVWEAGTVRQVVNAYSETDFTLTYSSCKRTEELIRKKNLLLKQTMRAFRNLERGPLCRGIVFKIENAGYHFLFIIHHIIADDWSMHLLRREFIAAYAAIEQGQAAGGEKPVLQLRDYAARCCESGEEAKVAQYWTSKLAGADQYINLRKVYDWYRSESGVAGRENLPALRVNTPGAYLEKALHNTSGDAYYTFLDHSGLERLAATARQLHTNSQLLILASLNILLCIVYGTPRVLMILRLHSRFFKESEQVLGNLTSAVYSYLDQTDLSTCRDLVRAILQEFSEASDWKVYNPLTTRAIPLTTASHVCVNILTEDGSRQPTGGHPGDAPEKVYFSLDSTVVFCSNCIVFKWTYNPLVFRGNVVKAIASRSLAIIQRILDDPETPIEAFGRPTGQEAFQMQQAPS